MKELMQKAMSALNQRKSEVVSGDRRSRGRKPTDTVQPDDWGMSPEDALRVGTVARYK